MRVPRPAWCRGAQWSTPPAVTSPPAEAAAGVGVSSLASRSQGCRQPSGAARELMPQTGSSRYAAMACSRVIALTVVVGVVADHAARPSGATAS